MTTTIARHRAGIKRRRRHGLVEMSWDPITRIVGSLGIYTKIDFENREVVGVPQHVVDLPRLLDLHEGQGPARRALHHQPHLRHLRRQPRHLLLLRAEHGLRREAAAPRRVDHQPRRGRRVHVRPQHLPGEPGRRRLLREDGHRDQPRRAGQGARTHRGAARRRPRLPHDRRHHARAQPVHRRVLPRGAAGEPLDARDVLPDGGPARPPLDALPGRRRHRRDDPAVHRLPDPADALRRVHEEGRARCTTTSSTSSTRRCPATRRSASGASCSAAGARSRTPRYCNFAYKDMDRLGPRRCSSPPASSSTASSSPPTWSTSTSASGSCSGSSYYDDWDDQEMFVKTRSAGQPGRPAPPVEPAHHPASRRSATSTTSTAG